MSPLPLRKRLQPTKTLLMILRSQRIRSVRLNRVESNRQLSVQLRTTKSCASRWESTRREIQDFPSSHRLLLRDNITMSLVSRTNQTMSSLSSREGKRISKPEKKLPTRCKSNLIKIILKKATKKLKPTNLIMLLLKIMSRFQIFPSLLSYKLEILKKEENKKNLAHMTKGKITTWIS